ncbi:hypothetical protein CYMTET_46872 [Cymbomonas tetramitiformis]|uniref:Glycosyl hydrolase family 30 TIM-barrel domain-containing protein n=1 Tax=Cymbomonas tetramitiformis TaxID=36881 RepID=A0AAE0EY97_9CHLO|nr:hypothetical protein CYMTET_46872 [Cymbomonas tetramitiformis]
MAITPRFRIGFVGFLFVAGCLFPLIALLALKVKNDGGLSTEHNVGQASLRRALLQDDEAPPSPPPPPFSTFYVHHWHTVVNGSVIMKEWPKMHTTLGQFPDDSINILTRVDENERFQEMAGYGLALTHASAHNMLQIKYSNHSQYMELLHDLFACEEMSTLDKYEAKNESFKYETSDMSCISVLRIPISATEFIPGDNELAWWTHDDNNFDWTLDKVNIDSAMNTTVAVLKDILQFRPNIKLFAVPNTAPAWMKTSWGDNKYVAWTCGELVEEHFPLYADFLMKVLQLYAAQGISFYRLILQQRPYEENQDVPQMQMSADSQVRLASLLFERGIDAFDLKIIAHDGDWDKIDEAVGIMKGAGKAIAGVAFQCQGGDIRLQDELHTNFTDKEFHVSKCSGFGEANFTNNFAWAMDYLYISGPRNWASSVMHYNLMLDEDSGPHQGGCGWCRGALTLVKEDSGYSIVKNEEYWGIHLMSKWLRPGARRVSTEVLFRYDDNVCVDAISFRNVDGSTVMVAANQCEASQWFAVQRATDYFDFDLPVGYSLFYWPEFIAPSPPPPMYNGTNGTAYSPPPSPPPEVGHQPPGMHADIALVRMDSDHVFGTICGSVGVLLALVVSLVAHRNLKRERLASDALNTSEEVGLLSKTLEVETPYGSHQDGSCETKV